MSASHFVLGCYFGVYIKAVFTSLFFLPQTPVEGPPVISYSRNSAGLQKKPPCLRPSAKMLGFSFLLYVVTCAQEKNKAATERYLAEGVVSDLGEVAAPFVTSQKDDFQNCMFWETLFLISGGLIDGLETHF